MKLASAFATGEIRIWNLLDLEESIIFGLGEDFSLFHSMSWSPDSEHLAISQSSSLIHIRNSMNGDLVSSFRHVGGSYISWSPSGRLASAQDSIMIWSPFDSTPSSAEPYINIQKIESLAWSPDGVLLISSSSYGPLRVLEPAGSPVFRFPFIERVTALCWSWDGSNLALGTCDCSLYVWNRKSGELKAIKELERACGRRIDFVTWS